MTHDLQTLINWLLILLALQLIRWQRRQERLGGRPHSNGRKGSEATAAELGANQEAE